MLTVLGNTLCAQRINLCSEKVVRHLPTQGENRHAGHDGKSNPVLPSGLCLLGFQARNSRFQYLLF